MLGELAFQLGDLLVEQLGGALEVGFALGALGFHARLLELFLDLAHAAYLLLLALPFGGHLRRALAQL